jgi:hypothetical protein
MDNTNITSVAITTYLSFSVIFFVVCVFNDWPVWQYLAMFLVFTFVIQLGINTWASGKLCSIDSNKNNINIGKSIGYTIVPWALILVLMSFILYIMPGWVRVFSNTLGLAVVRSVYYELFNLKSRPVAEDTPDAISPELINEIYHDPSKLINEIEYLSDFNEWKVRIFDAYLKNLPYFKENFNDADLFGLKGGSGEVQPSDEGVKKGMTVNTKSNIYQLYKCVATKEKIGYFTWLFLSGAIFTLTSLSQLYESDC